MRDLADASVEGLLVCDGETIVSVNSSFAHLAGMPASSLVGAGLEVCFPDKAARARLLAGSNQAVETSLRHRDGSATPVELLLRPIVFCRTAASCRRGARPAGAQGSRAAYPLPRASRRADIDSQSQLLQLAGRSGNREPGRQAKVSPCSASISTGSRKSTICSVMPPATRCCRRWRRASPRCSANVR